MSENIFNNGIAYKLEEARLLTTVLIYLRSNIYPSEHTYIQDRIMAECPDITGVIFSANHSDNVIVLTPKSKSKHINIDNLRMVIFDIVKDIYQRNIINVYGKDHPYSSINVIQLFNIINMNEQVKIYI